MHAKPDEIRALARNLLRMATYWLGFRHPVGRRLRSAFHEGKFAERWRRGSRPRAPESPRPTRRRRSTRAASRPRTGARLALLDEVMRRAEAQARQAPGNANALYLCAYAAGRYSQRISVAKALAQGHGGKIRIALERALVLEPKHAEARLAMGTWHAEVIDKVGAMVGGLTYGAKKEAGERPLRKALELYARAAKMRPRDAMEKLDVERARAELE